MSQRARRRHRQSRGSVGKKVALVFGVLLATVGVAAGAAGIWVLDVAASAPSIDTLKPITTGGSSEVFAADGTRLGYVQSDVNREEVDLKEIPKVLQKATIAIEDENFWEHDGVDPAAIARAALENIEAGFEVRQGASTITQQLVRNLYLEDPEDTLERKIIEADMARQYEDRYSKREILEQYLNTASYGTVDGSTAVGVEAASQVFFDKHVSDLNLGEAALLAGLPQAPTDYNPFLNPEGATSRRGDVLKAMYDQGYISLDEYEETLADGLGLQRGYRYEERTQEYFFDYVQQELIDRYGVQTVRQGGLKVYTTLEPRLQAAAEQAILAHPITGAASALVSTDTKTGEILAMASSESYDSSKFNLAAQGKRQPGSAFKPFVLTTAVDQGIDPDSTYYAAPSSITLTIPGGEPWPVSGGGSGSMSLRDATANSVNTVFAQLALDVGADNFTEMATRMGIQSELGGYPAEALGGLTQGVSVLEMSNAYATLANGGVHHKPTAIERVDFPDGEVDQPIDEEGTRVLSDGVAYTVADIMTGTLDFGTASCCDIPCPAAGKTGTTELQSDAWFVGYTPHISTAVWTGNPDARVPLPGYGADLSAPIWQEFMLTAIGDNCDDFPAPENPVELDSFYSEHTSSSSSIDEFETTTGAVPTTPTTVAPEEVEDSAEPTGDPNFDPELYAPGAGQEAAPTTEEPAQETGPPVDTGPPAGAGPADGG
ncbi:MAG TPA: transglycosylase domain-containing protein, partial [Solirubrobacterales bacterium]|nr:transglycosylase domain-containing protein [Solirubrobacterales bacterium]